MEQTPSDVVMAAIRAARGSYSNLRSLNPQASMAHVYFVALNPKERLGRAAALRVLVNQGQTMEQAERAVASKIAESKSPTDFPLLGTIVPVQGVVALLGSAGVGTDEMNDLLRRLTHAPDNDELRIVVMASSVELAFVRDAGP